ncbi:hypothetical protein [Desulfovibrio inopinatus]|uniref:hypothetical protein n=1 Tax=Desulfovibrio inopinatus TaxID=102109 RepID=UPI0003FD9DE4|nr:hypothetical protein [Desulfovibrio inopinatus]
MTRRFFLTLCLVGVIVLPLCLIVHTAAAQNIVIDGLPSQKASASATEARLDALDATQSQDFRLKIIKSDGQYLWASRGNKPLSHVVSGVFHIFYDTTGGGYVKIIDWAPLPPSMKKNNTGVSYFEFISSGMKTITYFGSADSFTP